ncbi:DNA-directed RNA polymerase subunit delta [Virgibacillus sp. W0430]|uniref:DNA-directed RNA polymerase subunit delta n=1 Tax=Virgibacillus sp. W0430 TaxID=3391580 RepID=UPI003F48C804
MSLDNYSHADVKEMSMIELANLILMDAKEAMNFNDLFSKISDLKAFTESAKSDNIARFYTDLNVDGRFITLGSNVWGLKRWYPINQVGEIAVAEPKAKKRAEVKDDDFELEDIDFELDDDDFEIDEEPFDEGYNDEYMEDEEEA